MVRPHLEYGNVIWGPHFKGDMKANKKVQRHTTKMIPGLKDTPYTDRLQALISPLFLLYKTDVKSRDLPSLSYRRKRGDMIMYYKIIKNKININQRAFFTLNELNTRGHKFKIQKTKRATKQVRCQSFAIRSVNDWNNLPLVVVQAKSTNEFKNLLDKYRQEMLNREKTKKGER